MDNSFSKISLLWLFPNFFSPPLFQFFHSLRSFQPISEETQPACPSICNGIRKFQGSFTNTTHQSWPILMHTISASTSAFHNTVRYWNCGNEPPVAKLYWIIVFSTSPQVIECIYVYIILSSAVISSFCVFFFEDLDRWMEIVFDEWKLILFCRGIYPWPSVSRMRKPTVRWQRLKKRRAIKISPL